MASKKADIVFCLDSSGSMTPCFTQLKENISGLIESLNTIDPQLSGWDLRFDFVAHNAVRCDSNGTPSMHGDCAVMMARSVNSDNIWEEIYGNPKNFGFNQGLTGKEKLFTTDVNKFKAALNNLEAEWEEATFIGLDLALDMPWRADGDCHRVVVFLSDEQLETGLVVPLQEDKSDQLVRKIQELGILLLIVAPESEGYMDVARADKSEYEMLDSEYDGLINVNFAPLMEQLAKSISASTTQKNKNMSKPKPLFNQFNWINGLVNPNTFGKQ